MYLIKFKNGEKGALVSDADRFKLDKNNKYMILKKGFRKVAYYDLKIIDWVAETNRHNPNDFLRRIY